MLTGAAGAPPLGALRLCALPLGAPRVTADQVRQRGFAITLYARAIRPSGDDDRGCGRVLGAVHARRARGSDGLTLLAPQPGVDYLLVAPAVVRLATVVTRASVTNGTAGVGCTSSHARTGDRRLEPSPW